LALAPGPERRVNALEAAVAAAAARAAAGEGGGPGAVGPAAEEPPDAARNRIFRGRWAKPSAKTQWRFLSPNRMASAVPDVDWDDYQISKDVTIY